MGPRDDPSLEWTKLPGLQPVLQLIEAALLQSVYTSKLLLYRSLRGCAKVKCRACTHRRADGGLSCGTCRAWTDRRAVQRVSECNQTGLLPWTHVIAMWLLTLQAQYRTNGWGTAVAGWRCEARMPSAACVAAPLAP